MSDYIQSNNDSGNLALYAGIGLAGAAGGAALTYRMTRDPSNGKTAATGKESNGATAAGTAASATTSAAGAAAPEPKGSKLGALARIFKGGNDDASLTVGDSTVVPASEVPDVVAAKGKPQSTVSSSKLVSGVDLGSVTSTQVPGFENLVDSIGGTTASTPTKPTASHTPSPFPNVSGIDPTTVPLTAQAPTAPKFDINEAYEQVAQQQQKPTARTHGSTVNPTELHNIDPSLPTKANMPKPTQPINSANVTVTSRVPNSSIDLSKVQQSVQGRRTPDNKRSRRGKGGKGKLKLFI